MKKMIQALVVISTLVAGANAAYAAGVPVTSSASFEEVTDGSFTEAFTLIPSVTNKMSIVVSGASGQFSALSASLWSGAVQLASFSSGLVMGNHTVSIRDGRDSAFSLTAGQAYTLKVSGVRVASPNTAIGSISTFNGTVSAVPEPESFALLLAGLGLVGMAAKRGRKQIA